LSHICNRNSRRYAWAFVGSPEHLELSQRTPANGLVRSFDGPSITPKHQNRSSSRSHHQGRRRSSHHSTAPEVQINGDVVNFIAKDIENDVVLIERSPTRSDGGGERRRGAVTVGGDDGHEPEALEAERWQEEVNRSSESGSGSLNEVKFLPHVSRIAQLMRDKVTCSFYTSTFRIFTPFIFYIIASTEDILHHGL
jgi:hypothetical protein